MNKPKRQHYVPITLLNRFVDRDDWLYCYNATLESPNIWKSKPNNVFLENHIYTQYGSDGEADVSVESGFSSLEGDAAPVIEKMVLRATTGKAVHFSRDERNVWITFLIHQRRRTPDNHSVVESGVHSLLAEFPQALEKHLGRPPTEEELDRERMSSSFKNAGKNAFAIFAGAEPKSKLLAHLQHCSLQAGVVMDPKYGLIVGSSPIDQLADWFPIDCRVAVRLTTRRCPEDPTSIDNSLVSSINQQVAKRSTLIAGPSREQITSLVQSIT